MRFRSAIIATAVFATPFAAAMFAMPMSANAQPVTGPYISAGAGLSIPQAPRATPLARGFGTGQVELKEDYGFNSDLAVGYGLGNGFRFEIEGDFLRSNMRQITGSPFPSASGGTVRTWGAMANAIYDMDIGVPWMFPYLGVGAGYQWTKLNGVSSVQDGGPFAFSTSDQSGAFAWQAILGASFPVPGVPGLSLTADYRFMDILGGQKFNIVDTTAAGTVGGQIKLHNQFNHELVFGIRYAFDTPAPAAPAMAPTPIAAPAPALARSYLIFFDWDKADLTERARSIVREAAENSTHVQLTKIDVNGYTDTSGSAGYNQGLSVRRAKAVAGELVRDGVPQNVITIQGFGETHLLVPTGPGVREPQNRRVEIILH
jgi:OOP family OmpA-OmpF porin